eukprot:TRINITY_DN1076_c1_g2_i3.p1 TRINITY_DN1076_c1_g2~~TRINITY_DN1076_c1_g2_i3.p1  ORF type:complete len:456 (+),score=109.38 TRINITY_DN1076_c1_g2_i3:54-1421(+)
MPQQSPSEWQKAKRLLAQVIRWEHPLISLVMWTKDVKGPAGKGEPNYTRMERACHLVMDFMLSMALNFMIGFGVTTDGAMSTVGVWFVASALYWVLHMVLVYPVAYVLSSFEPDDIDEGKCGIGSVCQCVTMLYGLFFIGLCAWLCFDVSAAYGCGSLEECSTTVYVQDPAAAGQSCQPTGCSAFDESVGLFKNHFAKQHAKRWLIDFGWNCKLVSPTDSGYEPAFSLSGLQQLNTPMPCNPSVTTCGGGNAEPLVSGWGPVGCSLAAAAYCKCVTEYKSVPRLVLQTLVSYCIVSWWITIPVLHFALHYVSGKLCCGRGTPMYQYCLGMHASYDTDSGPSQQHDTSAANPGQSVQMQEHAPQQQHQILYQSAGIPQAEGAYPCQQQQQQPASAYPYHTAGAQQQQQPAYPYQQQQQQQQQQQAYPYHSAGAQQQQQQQQQPVGAHQYLPHADEV